MMKQPKRTIITLLSFLLLFLAVALFPQPTSAQVLTNTVCGGSVLYNGHTTFCSVVNVGGTLATGFTGCGAGAQCWQGDVYGGCANVDLNSCGATYEQSSCTGTAAPDTTWTAEACTSQKQGCFVPYPGTNGGGVCVPPEVAKPFSCANPPNTSCQANTFGVCFNSPAEAGVGQYGYPLCDCAEGIGLNSQFLCFYKDEASHTAAIQKYTDSQKPWGNNWCPICPPGYFADPNEKVCNSITDTTGVSKTQPTSFTTCTTSSCAFGQSGAGCQQVFNGCSRRTTDTGVTSDCAGAQPLTCSTSGGDLCCPDTSACAAAGGSAAHCVAISRVGGVIDDCNQTHPAFPITCNTLTGVNTNTDFCCDTITECLAKGRASTPEQTSFEGLCAGGINAIDTAIGCVPIDGFAKLSGFFISWGLGIGGGVAFLSLIAGSFLLMTSSGDIEKLTQGKEIVISAISGIIVLVFAVFIFRTIGMNILGLF